MLYLGIKITSYAYFGFLEAMILNVFIPHLAATVVLKEYAPGLLSGLLLNLPLNEIIVYRAIQANVINIKEFIVSAIVVGIILLVSLPCFFKIGKLIEHLIPATAEVR